MYVLDGVEKKNFHHCSVPRSFYKYYAYLCNETENISSLKMIDNAPANKK